MVTRTHAGRERRVVKKGGKAQNTNHQVVLPTLVEVRWSSRAVLDRRRATDHPLAVRSHLFTGTLGQAVTLQMENVTPARMRNIDKNDRLKIRARK